MLSDIGGNAALAGWTLFLPLCIAAAASVQARGEDLGQFETHADVGDVAQAGSVKFDAATGVYTITGGGADMWGTADAFHFLSKAASGDVTITADIKFLGDGSGEANRKACLLIRQSVAPGAAYVDAAQHGDGHIDVQWRETADGPTGDAGPKDIHAPKTLRIEKHGDQFQMYAAAEGEPLKAAGEPFKLTLKEPFVIGLGVCSHDNNRLETVEFSNVMIEAGK